MYSNRNKKCLWIRLCLIIFVVGCKTTSNSQTIEVGYDDSNIIYEGRIGRNRTQKASEIYWSGSSIKISFEGTQLKAVLEDQNGTNYFNVFIDSKAIDVLRLKKGKHEYVLAEGLSDGKHMVELTKRNEWTYGTTLFYGFKIKGSKALKPDQSKKLFIEFYGDSITTGHGNEDEIGNDDPTGNVTNNYNTYAAMTARELDAEYSCIARGGIGIMVSWFNMIMPEMYDRLNPNDASSKWDFDKKQPDIVVINLFQNDSWLVNLPDHVEFKRRFGKQKPDENFIINSYQAFVKRIRGHYPKATIVCLLGNMDVTKENSKWPDYVKLAIEPLDDQNIFTCFVPFKESKGHPNVEEHKMIAKSLLELTNKEIISKD